MHLNIDELFPKYYIEPLYTSVILWMTLYISGFMTSGCRSLEYACQDRRTGYLACISDTYRCDSIDHCMLRLDEDPHLAGCTSGEHYYLAGCTSGEHYYLAGCTSGEHYYLAECTSGEYYYLAGCTSGEYYYLAGCTSGEYYYLAGCTSGEYYFPILLLEKLFDVLYLLFVVH